MLVIGISYSGGFTCSATPNDTVFPEGDTCQDYLDFLCKAHPLDKSMRREIEEIMVIDVEYENDTTIPVVLNHFSLPPHVYNEENEDIYMTNLKAALRRIEGCLTCIKYAGGTLSVRDTLKAVEHNLLEIKELLKNPNNQYVDLYSEV